MKKLSRKQSKELRALASMKDSEINLQDAPEVVRRDRAIVGKFYRPIKRPLTVRLDADVLAWLKSEGKGYQTRLNGLLRDAMEKRSHR
jgi:uncharacterized protein (DUF4415 family)